LRQVRQITVLSIFELSLSLNQLNWSIKYQSESRFLSKPNS